jgi:hypothetical protein
MNRTFSSSIISCLKSISLIKRIVFPRVQINKWPLTKVELFRHIFLMEVIVGYISWQYEDEELQ